MNPTDAALEDVQRYLDAKRKAEAIRHARDHWRTLAASGRKNCERYRGYVAEATHALLILERNGRIGA